MITCEEAKEYLRINIDDDDNLINEIIVGGYDYLRDAIDDFDEIYEQNETFARKCDLFVKTKWIPPNYDNREGMEFGADKLSYTARSLLTQLSLYTIKKVKNLETENCMLRQKIKELERKVGESNEG